MRVSHKIVWISQKWEKQLQHRATLENALKAFDMTLQDFYVDMCFAMSGRFLPPRSLKEFGKHTIANGGGDLLPTILADFFSTNYFKAYHALRRNPAVERFRIKHPKEFEEWGSLFIVSTLERFMNHKDNIHRDFGDVLIDFVNKIAMEEQPWQLLEEMIEEGDVDGYNITRKMDRFVRVSELIDKLMIDYSFASKHCPDTIEVKQPDEDISIRSNNSLTEISKLSLSELLKDEDIPMKAIQGKLQINVHMAPDSPPRHFIMLIDQSGSMDIRFAEDYTRFDYALASAVCLIKNALKGSNRAKIGFFDFAVNPVMEGGDPNVVNNLMAYSVGGGGTSIQTALLWAKEQKPDEIILITDGEDTVDPAVFDKDMPPVTLYQVGSENHDLSKLVNVVNTVKEIK